MGWNSRALVTNARSAGVAPAVLSKENLVAMLAFSNAELSTMDTPTMVRIDPSVATGARNQKLSVKPSPSVSVKVREMTLRSVP